MDKPKKIHTHLRRNIGLKYLDIPELVKKGHKHKDKHNKKNKGHSSHIVIER